MAKSSNTLGFVGDGDELSLVFAVQKAFQIKLTQPDADRIVTMGDLHDVLVEKLSEVGGAKCASMMTFLRIRRALAELQPSVRIAPATPLTEVSSLSPRRLWKHLAKSTGLAIPGPDLTWIGGVGWLACLAWFIGLFVFDWLDISLWWISPLLVTGIAMIWFDPRSFGAIGGVGDLARHCTARNHGALARLGARSSAEDIWNALIEIAADCSESEIRRHDINQETTLIRPDRRRQAA
jgi:hypothetical protein